MAFGDTERPAWLDEPCPVWCARQHRESDHPDDRQHQNEGIVLSAVFFRWGGVGEPDSEAAELVVSVSRPIHQSEIRVFIGEAEGSEQFLRISFDTAQRLSVALDRTLEAIRAA